MQPNTVHPTDDLDLHEPTLDELVEGMAVAFTVAGDRATVTVRAYVNEIEEHGDADPPRSDYPRRITLEEYHRGTDDTTHITNWRIDPLRHRVWSKAPCDDEHERAGDLEGFSLQI